MLEESIREASSLIHHAYRDVPSKWSFAKRESVG